MSRPASSVAAQTCPNCGRSHDVSVYVSGQKILCGCGIRFEVKRHDVTLNERRSKAAEAAGEPPAQPDAEPAAALPFDATTPSRSAQGAPEHEVGLRTQLKNAGAPPEVPGYVLEELLGRGGMGEVWRATQLSLGRTVALKLLPERFASDPEFVRRFEKEATALAVLSHPNIVQIIDRGKAGPHYYFVMELVPGTNLREMLNGGRLPLRDALRIGAQVAKAIDAAHDQGVIHRDLKPENVLVDPRGHVKIADFGLAGIRDQQKNIALTATAVAMGTVNYMAPEQRRDAKNVDHRADLYSLGVLLYEVLTHELPLGRFKVPSHHSPGLDPRVDELVCQLLETDPTARPKRAGVAAELFEQLVFSSASGAPASQPPLLSTAPPGAVQVGVPAWKVGVVVLLVLLAVGLGLKLLPRGGPPAPAHAPGWYGDTDDELFSTFDEKDGRLVLRFDSIAPDAGEELNAHSGHWTLEDGALSVVQYGEAQDTELHPTLKPRTYVAHRYFSADSVDLEALMTVKPLPAEFPLLAPEAQRFGELAFRIKDLQVSVFAIPGVGMRLLWRYFTPDGREFVGNSAQDLKDLVEDEMAVPTGQFKVRLKLERLKGGDVSAEAFVNGARFARKSLPGLAGQVGKVAFGCRNAACTFDDVAASGKATPRPPPKKAEVE